MRVSVVVESRIIVTLPGVGTMPWRLMVHEENVVVTSTGYTLLSERADAALPVV